MADPWLMNAFDQFMEENPDYFERPEVIADLEEANRRHEELWGDQRIPAWRFTFELTLGGEFVTVKPDQMGVVDSMELALRDFRVWRQANNYCTYDRIIIESAER